LQDDEDPLDADEAAEETDEDLYAPEDADEDGPELLIDDPDSLDRDPFA